jgi:hypothetical protein
MKRRRLAFVCGAALAVALLLPYAKVQAATLPVSGSGTTAAGTPVNFTGNLDISKFVRQGSQVLAVGTLTGTVTDTLGSVLGTVTNLPVQLPLLFGPNGTSGTCDILDLVLGPLHLDLLGLVVDLNQINLTITAQSGPGKLLGNLLCAVANLFNQNPLNLTALAGRLNNILRNL